MAPNGRRILEAAMMHMDAYVTAWLKASVSLAFKLGIRIINSVTRAYTMGI